MWALSPILLNFCFPDWSESGSFGDSFGAINSLFSGLALLGIIWTIYLQRNELTLQREELKKTREEFNAQNKTLSLQLFENTFFNLLKLHHQIVDSMDFDYHDTKKEGNTKFVAKIQDIFRSKPLERITLKGRDVFKETYEDMVGELDDSYREKFIGYYKEVQTDYGHYFRNLYRIVKFVDESTFVSNNDSDNIDEEMLELENHKCRYKYISIVRSQLSDYELLWLFYNCLSINGFEKFKPLIEKYSLLKNLPKDELHDINAANCYHHSAYGQIKK